MVETASPASVRNRLENGSRCDIIDVRDAEAYTDGHIPGAEHLPVEELEETVTTREWADEVIVYCYVGQTSVQAARLITEYGGTDTVLSMAGGYEAWESAVEATTD